MYQVFQNLIKSNQAYTTTLVVMLFDEFEPGALEWAPETLAMEIEDRFHVKVSSAIMDRLMAGIALMTSNRFYVQLPDFNELCCVLSGEPLTPDVVQLADAASIAWGITEAMLLSPPDDLDNTFTEEIRAFIGEVIKSEGIITPPDILQIGSLDKKITESVNQDYSDDPTMFAAIYDVQKGRSDEINTMVRNRLTDLVSQLTSLKLQNGNIEDVAEKMLSALSRKKVD